MSKIDYFSSVSHRKIELLLKILKVLIFLIAGMSIVRLFEHNYIQFWADIVFLIFVIVSYIVMKNNIHYYKILIRIVYFVAVVFAIFIMIYQYDNPIRFIWLSTAIYMIYYLFDRKEAPYWIVIVAILMYVGFLIDPNDFHISFASFMIWMINMFILLMIAHWYAVMEEKSKEKMLKTQDILTKEVKRKTKELRLLNENLESKIEEKTRENMEQEKLLFRQARYAQMGEMISMIAHQWRQPLNTISVTTAALEAYMAMNRYDKAFFQEKIKVISDSTTHLSSTIDDFRNFFKLDKVKEKTSFSHIIQNALHLTLPSLQTKQIDVQTTFECNCFVYSYPNEIIHVVLNLLKNAEDALIVNKISDPQIHISTYKSGKMAIMEIEDNAGGIPSAIVDKIFDPYFTTKEKNDGTGLGLYMSKIIIEDHCQGKIEMLNGKRGALFRLYIPLYDEAYYEEKA